MTAWSIRSNHWPHSLSWQPPKISEPPTLPVSPGALLHYDLRHSLAGRRWQLCDIGRDVNATAGSPLLNRPGWLCSAAVECPSISAGVAPLGSLAMFTAMRNASSRVSNFADDRRPDLFSSL